MKKKKKKENFANKPPRKKTILSRWSQIIPSAKLSIGLAESLGITRHAVRI